MSRIQAAAKVHKSWPELKSLASTRHLEIRHEASADLYECFCVDDGVLYVAVIYRGTVPDHCGVTQESNDAYESDFESNYVSQVCRSRTDSGIARIAYEKTDRPKKNFFSHDWADPTTWTGTAVRVVDEIATGSSATYTLANAPIVDACHGKLFGEDAMVDANGHSFRVLVKVNDVLKTEQDPHYGTGGDYTVNYATGVITFLSAPAAGAVVKVTYHRVVDSTFVVKPDPGKLLNIIFAEVQFSGDIEIRDTVQFQPYGYVDVFAPHLVGPVPSGTKIPLGAPVTYKTMRDYQTEAVKAYASYPAIGGSSWRGMAQPVVVLDWDYVASTPIRSDAGMEIRIKLQHDTPFGGSFATCSFYCTSESIAP